MAAAGAAPPAIPVGSMIPTSPALYPQPAVASTSMPCTVTTAGGSYVPAPIPSQAVVSVGSYVPQMAGSYVPHAAGAYAAPSATYMLPSAGSFVPAPVPGTAAACAAQEAAGVSLTEGIPDPESIDQQKRAYERGLDAELDQTKKMAEAQVKQQKAAMKAAAEQQLAMYKAQMEQAIRQQELSLDQHLQHQEMELQQAFLKQKAALEQQATSLAMEYQQRKMQEDLMLKQAEMQRDMQDMHRRMHQEMTEHQQQQFQLEQRHADQRRLHHEEMQSQQANLLQSQAQLQQEHAASMQRGEARGAYGERMIYAAPVTPSALSAGGAMGAPSVVYQAPPQPLPVYAAASPITHSLAQVPEQSLAMEPVAQVASMTPSVQQMATYPDLLSASTQTQIPGMGGVSMGATSNCSNCGNVFMADSLFCRHCGKKRQEVSSSCPNCGNIYLPDAMFCRHCGQKRAQTPGQAPQRPAADFAAGRYSYSPIVAQYAPSLPADGFQHA